MAICFAELVGQSPKSSRISSSVQREDMAGPVMRPCNACAKAPPFSEPYPFTGPGNLRKAVAGPARSHSFEVVDSVEAAISVLIVWGKLRSGIHLQ
jgi:hypothetical protein